MDDNIYTLPDGRSGTLEELAQQDGVKVETIRRRIRRAAKAAADAPRAKPTPAMRKEADVKRRIQAALKRHGAWFTMPHQAGFSQAGVPDFLVCIGGRFLGIEAKFGGNAPTAHQKRQLLSIRQAGGLSIVINDANVGQLESLLLAIKEGKV